MPIAFQQGTRGNPNREKPSRLFGPD